MTQEGVSVPSVVLDARDKRRERLERRRLDEARCAWDFLFHGDTRGEHAADCVYVERGLPACSREYHPGPKPEDENLYKNTPLGVLWGLNDPAPLGDPYAWQLAGWNVTRRKDRA